jgi:hypothetical protein
LRRLLKGHTVSTAFEMGWAELGNGELLNAAETTFDALITTDQNLRYQQSVGGRRLAILVLPTTSWPIIERHAADVIAAVDGLQVGELRLVTFRQSH